MAKHEVSPRNLMDKSQKVCIGLSKQDLYLDIV